MRVAPASSATAPMVVQVHRLAPGAALMAWVISLSQVCIHAALGTLQPVRAHHMGQVRLWGQTVKGRYVHIGGVKQGECGQGAPPNGIRSAGLALLSL